MVLCFAFGLASDAFAQLLGQWHFDENSGSVATDSAGGNHGTLHGDATFVAGGISGNAVSMTKAGDGLVEIADIFPMTSGDLTIVVWFKMDSGDQQADSIFLAKHEGGYVNGYFLGANTSGPAGQTDKAYLYYTSGGFKELISTTTVNDGAWHQIAVVHRESGPVELYIDGLQEASGPGGPMIPSPALFMVGGALVSGASNGVWNGLVDELEVFGSALSSSDILWLFDHPGSGLAIHTDGFESTN